MNAEGAQLLFPRRLGAGAFLQPFTVPVGAPCETVLTGQTVHHPDQLRAIYPHVRLIADLGVVSYCGVPVADRTGRMIGAYRPHGRQADAGREADDPILKVFASRIAAEQERKREVQSLEHSRSLLQSFVEHIPAAVAMLDRQLRYVAVSQRWYQDYQLGDAGYHRAAPLRRVP